jgi:hypothetical protein
MTRSIVGGLAPRVSSDEPSCEVAGRSRVLGRPVVADFDPLRQKLQEHTDPKLQEPTLPNIDSMQFVDVAEIERLEDRDETIGGNIILDYERCHVERTIPPSGNVQSAALAFVTLACRASAYGVRG